MCIASAAGAVTLVAGGATLPAVGYTGSSTFSTSSGVLAPITTMATGSLFGTYISSTTGVDISYCPTGSGLGKKIFANNDSNFQASANCGAINPLYTTGFGVAGAIDADFVGSDAPFSLTEYLKYKIGHNGALPTQLPAIAGAIGISFKKEGVNAMTLTEDQICGIFSGQIKTWHDLAISGVNLPVTMSDGPINVVYRSDDSGTSFSFLNHLSKVCPTVASNPSFSFKTLQSYAAGAAQYISGYSSSVAARGDAGVVAAVGSTTTDGSIGYAEVASSVAGRVKMASVTNLRNVTINPLVGFGPTPITVTVVFDKAIADSPDPTTGRPQLVPLPDSGTCIGLVNPDDYADAAMNPSQANRYPIIAISSLLGNAHGNGTNLAAVRGLLGSPYNTVTTFRNAVTKIGRAATGYAWLDAGLTQATVDNCIVD